MRSRILFFAFIALFVALACRKQSTFEKSEYSDAPLLPEKPHDYPRSTNDHAAALGRVLFYDKNLSLNNSVSCSSCHEQSKAFCDGKQFSTGLVNGLTSRNAPSVFFRSGRLFWDGRSPDMISLVLRPLENHVEMRMADLTELPAKLSSTGYYPDLFKKAFGSSAIDTNKIRTAMNEFMRNFVFNENRFKRSVDRNEPLNPIEEAGRVVFFGKGRCATCHNLRDDGTGGGTPVYYGNTEFPRAEFNIGLDEVYSDKGIGELTGISDDYGKFNIPVLFNVEYTAPYMHDGRFKTLEEVVEHYNSGLKNHPNLDIRLRNIGEEMNFTAAQLLAKFDKNANGRIDPSEMAAYPPVQLNLSAFEKKALVEFLKTLSDPRILTDKMFASPFVK